MGTLYTTCFLLRALSLYEQVWGPTLTLEPILTLPSVSLLRRWPPRSVQNRPWYGNGNGTEHNEQTIENQDGYNEENKSV